MSVIRPVDYDDIGSGYSSLRRPDPRLAAVIDAALGDARTVVNVGAGTGSYEPPDRDVTAVEPSSVMIAQRAPSAAPCVQAAAETLPFADRSFDAAMAVLTLHHWSDLEAGLRELARVASRGVILTWDPGHRGFWLTEDYLPDMLEVDHRIFSPLAHVTRTIAEASSAPRVDVAPMLVPRDCTDGFFGAYWGRPEAYLDPAVRAAISTFGRIDPARRDAGLARLAADLASGAWKRVHGDQLPADRCDLGYRLVTW